MTDYRPLALALAQELERRTPSDPPVCLQSAREILHLPVALTPLERLELPTVVHNSLRRAGYGAIEQVAALTAADLARIKRLGPTGRRQLQDALSTWFLSPLTLSHE
jgi:DNA-directed RNA polymerase alpha subunit